jgi:putative transposase
MRSDMQAELVIDAVEMAISRRQPSGELIHHSDQGGQGGFNWSSQRSMREGCDGKACGLDAGVDGQGPDEVAGGAVVAARCRAVVLA